MPASRLIRPILLSGVFLLAALPFASRAELPSLHPSPSPSPIPFKPKIDSKGMTTSAVSGSGPVTYIFSMPKNPPSEELQILQEMNAHCKIVSAIVRDLKFSP